MSTVGAAHNVRVLGTGQTTVVLGHGHGTDQSVWRYLVPHLVEEYRVILYDNMGSGTTNPDYFDFDRYSTIQGYAHDLLAILEEFNAGEKCIFVGHSLSCMVAVYASILRPDLFSKLVVMSASPRYLNTTGYNGGFEQKDLDQLWNAMEENFVSLANGRAPMVVGSDMEGMAMQEFGRTLFNMRPDIAMSVVRTIFLFDMSERNTEIKPSNRNTEIFAQMPHWGLSVIIIITMKMKEMNLRNYIFYLCRFYTML